MGMINIHSVASLKGRYQNAKKNHEKHEGNLTESVTRKATTLKEETKTIENNSSFKY